MQLKASNCSFLNETHLNALKRLNIHTVEQFVSYSDLDNLSRLSRIPIETIKLAYKFLVGQYASLPQTGSDMLMKYLKCVFIVKIGCKQIDKLLCGGLYSSEITEIYGASCTGKSQICMNTCANILKSLNRKQTSSQNHSQDQETTQNKLQISTCQILYININGNFCLKRFLELLKYEQTNNIPSESVNEMLKQIRIINCETVFDLLNVLFRLEKPGRLVEKSTNEEERIIVSTLLVIDNMNILFNCLKNNNNADYLSYLHYTSRTLRHIASRFNIAILITNSYNNHTDRLGFGKTWEFVPHVRIYLNRKENEDTNVNLVKHVRIASNTNCKFQITKDGIL